MTVRRLEVAPERFPGWLDRLVDEHSGAVARVDGAVTHVAWDDGTAACESFPYEPIGLVLVRRGGYAVGLACGVSLVAVKVGRRHVQGRTAAGGWSQQRFARRRAGQADALVEAVAAHAHRILVSQATAEGHGIPAGLVVGGDRLLAAAVLAESGLAALAALPRRELFDLDDPDRRVLERAMWRARAVRVRLDESTDDGGGATTAP